MLKKKLALFMASLFLIASLLGGCGKSENGTDAQEGPSEIEEEQGNNGSEEETKDGKKGGAAMNLPFTTEEYKWDSVLLGGGGYVTGIVIHPTEPDLIYIRTDVGGAYRWEPDEKRWIPITDSFGYNEKHLYGIDGIAVDPFNPDVVYIAAGIWNNMAGDVLKSVDRGQTWEFTHLDKVFWGNGPYRWAGECLMVDPNNSNIIYCGTRYEGLWRSMDGAKTWEKAEGIPDDPDGLGIRSLAFDKSSVKDGMTQRIYAIANSFGLYTSSDGGKSWSLVEGTPKYPNGLAVASDGRVYLTSSEGLHVYQDGTWAEISPDGGSFHAIAVDPTDPEKVVTVAEFIDIKPQADYNTRDAFNLPIYYTENGGKTWVCVNNHMEKHFEVPWWPKNHFSAATAAVIMEPNDPKRVWFTDWFGIWMTPDITASPVQWYNYEKGHEEIVAFDAVSTPIGANLITGVADNDGTRHTDMNQYPEKKHGNPYLQETTGIDFCEKDPNFLARVGSWGWGQRGGGGYSTDNGKTWHEFESWPQGAIGYRCAVSADNPDNIVILPINSPPYYTMDRGKTWIQSKGAPSGSIDKFWSHNFPLASDRVVGGKFYLHGEGGLYVSTDGGATWSLVNESLGFNRNQKLKTAPGMEGEVWVSTNDSLRRSSDSGKTFKKIQKVTKCINFAFGKPAPGRENPSLYVYGTVALVEGIFRSDDMGETWVRINDDAHKLGNGANCMVGDRQIFGRVYIGSDGRGYFYGEPAVAD